jgi:hypothetical protein
MSLLDATVFCGRLALHFLAWQRGCLRPGWPMPIMALHHIHVLDTASVTAVIVRNVVRVKDLKDADIFTIWDVPAADSVGTLVLVPNCSNAVIGRNVFTLTLQTQAVSGRDVFALNLLAQFPNVIKLQMITMMVRWKSVTRWHNWPVITALLLLLAACSIPAITQPETQEVIITRDERDLPQGCSPREAAELMMRLLDAFNRGDQEQFVQFFPPTFQWYSDGWRTEIDGINIDEDYLFVSRPGNRQNLPDYVAERYQQGDRLQLYKASIMERDQRHALVNFQLTREADDVAPGVDGNKRYVNGSAMVVCENQTFFSLGMGIAPPDIQESDLSRMCPEPPAEAPENAVIACSELIYAPEEEG